MEAHMLIRYVVTLAALLVLAGVPVAEAQYRGSEFCFACHPQQYNEHKVSGHPYKLMSSVEAMNRPIPLPDGFGWDDVTYVIGGYKWKSRYLGLDGYIITKVDTDRDGVAETDGQNQYNNMTGDWVDYHPGEMKPYDCGACHTTGWVPDDDAETDGDLSDNQDGLPGIYGTFAFGGIQCEECHGAAAHFGDDFNPGDGSGAACGQCHIRGDPLTIPARNGFIRHHEQWNEQLASPHRSLDCTTCHNPHKKSELSIVRTCEDCHASIAAAYESTPMGVNGVECIDCHMPFASRSAVAFTPNRADVRTHLFRINTDRNGEMFTADGNFVQLDGRGQGAVTLDFACRDCHADKNPNWLAGQAKNFHKRRGAYAGGPAAKPGRASRR
jgi:hypothetical protein